MKVPRSSRGIGTAVLLGLMLSTHAHSHPAWSEPVAPTAAGTVAASYDLTRLNSYVARVEWRIVHHEANRTQTCGDAGSAIYLGGNLFLSAAHVIDENPLTNACAAFGDADPTVEFGGTELRAKVTAATHWTDNGGLYYEGGADLALLEVDARMMPLELRVPNPLSICEADLAPDGAEARIGTQYGEFESATAPRVNDEFARLRFAAKPGHSGAGIFDPSRGCLVGILSNGGVNGANYVSNANLRAFLAERYRGALRVAEPKLPEQRPSFPAAVVASSPIVAATPR